MVWEEARLVIDSLTTGKKSAPELYEILSTKNMKKHDTQNLLDTMELSHVIDHDYEFRNRKQEKMYGLTEFYKKSRKKHIQDSDNVILRKENKMIYFEIKEE